jgi:hypothetical protein
VLSSNELLSLLDREIEEAHREYGRPGWTPWALLTAGGALGWTFLRALDMVAAPLAVGMSALATVAVVEVAQRARAFLLPSAESTADGRVRISSDILSTQRPALVLELLCAGAIGWGIVYSRGHVTTLSSVAGLAWAGSMALLAVLGLAYSFWPVPLPDGLFVDSPLRVLQAIPIMLPFVTAVGLLAALRGLPLPDIRAGLTLGSASALFLAYVRLPEEPPLLGELVELRRRVALETIDPPEAVAALHVLLRGLRLVEYVQIDARRMLRALEELKTAGEEFGPVVDEIGRQTDALAVSGIEPASWKKLLDEWERRGVGAEVRARRFQQWHRRYERRLSLAAAMARYFELPYEGEALVAEIRPRVEEVTSEYRAMIKRYRAALERLQGNLKRAGQDPKEEA